MVKPSKPNNFKVLKQGAEGILYEGLYLNKRTIIKERFTKEYRNPALDQTLSRERLKAEIRAIVRCKSIGIKTPAIYFVNVDSRRIYMEHFTNGITVKDYIDQFTDDSESETKLTDLATLIGSQIGKMHANNIIHGDLTSSNMMLVNKNGIDEYRDLNALELAFIDFGLSHIENSPEDKGVDLYVLERAMASTHAVADMMWSGIIEGYKNGCKKGFKVNLQKYDDVKARGRKRTMVG